MKITTDHVHVVEVGPRDGLQNEKVIIPTEAKIDYITALADAGLRTIEAGAFVSPKWVPQMADTAEVYRNIPKDPGVDYPVLVPNMKGLERAIDVGVKSIAAGWAFALALKTDGTVWGFGTNWNEIVPGDARREVSERRNESSRRARLFSVRRLPARGAGSLTGSIR